MNKIVAIISADPETRELLTSCLELEDVTVHQFTNSREFGSARIMENVGVVLIDLLDGSHASKEVSNLSTAIKRFKKCKMISILPRGENEFRWKTPQFKFDVVIKKPFELMQVVKEITGHCEDSALAGDEAI